jgi:hypothetical protein
MLHEEIHKRSGRELPIVDRNLEAPVVPIILATVEDPLLSGIDPPEGLSIPETPEGYAIWVNSTDEKKQIVLAGRDERGVLFAAGRLLRDLDMGPDTFGVPEDLRIATAPKYPYRGHQLGYRHTANSYDAWDLAMYEQYIRDLVLFGTNGIELITSLDPSEYDGPVMERTQWEMNVDLAALVASYGLDVWFWMPVEGDLRDRAVFDREIAKRRAFFEACPRIDHIFVPGGDPGSNPPKPLLPWLEKMTETLHEFHPGAGVWLSNQKFTFEENDDLFAYLEEKKPTWLRGIAFGPGTFLTIEETRRRTPEQYQLRRYPDITHNVRCQYPVPEWDGRWAQTAGREAINPRPEATAHIHNVWAGYSDGFVSYSDGMHDDLNKMIWSALGWDPQTPVEEILQDYGKVFFRTGEAALVAKGLRGLEENWKGPLLENDSVQSTADLWRGLLSQDRNLELNWRFQMYLFRSLFDVLIQGRGKLEAEYEKEAYRHLSTVPEVGVAKAIEAARTALAQADRQRVAPEVRREIESLGIDLLGGIGFQLSVREPFRGKNPERGCLLDKVDRPLNDRPFLEDQFARILGETEEKTQLAMIDRLLNWEDPGPGGFYDDLGCAWNQPHLVRQEVWENDPMFLEGPQEAHYRSMNNETLEIAPLRYSWLDQAQTLYGLPLLVRYEDLDPEAEYRVRVTYFGRYDVPVRLKADGEFVIHDLLGASDPVWPVEFPVPKEATQDGHLELAWELEEGRGCQVAEVWLIRERENR